jgi:TMEM175 potassium channel family protein
VEGVAEKRCVPLFTTNALHLGTHPEQSTDSSQEELPLWGQGTRQPLSSPETLCCTACCQRRGRAQLGSRAAHSQDRQGHHMHEADQQPSQLSRVISFSDSVFAFAITLMVIIFPFQNVPHGLYLQQLSTLRGAFLAYLVSFYAIGLFWLSHQRYFRYLLTCDLGLFVLNLALLMCIAILPFPTYLLEADAFSSEAAAMYAGVLSLINVLYLLLWWYASSGHRLIAPTLEQDVIRAERVRRLLQVGVFVVSIGVALLNPYVALAVWFVGWVPAYVVRVRRRKSSSTGDE